MGTVAKRTNQTLSSLLVCTIICTGILPFTAAAESDPIVDDTVNEVVIVFPEEPTEPVVVPETEIASSSESVGEGEEILLENPELASTTPETEGDEAVLLAVALPDEGPSEEVVEQEAPDYLATCESRTNLLVNPSFETPTLEGEHFGWEVFPSGTPGLGWIVSWVTDDEAAPTPALLELQNSGNAYSAFLGMQYAELDANWSPAPGGEHFGEDARVRIEQTIPTTPGATYRMVYAFSALPGTSEGNNVLDVLLDGTVVDTKTADGSDLENTYWRTFTYEFVAASTSATVAFADAGVADTFGTLLDNVVLVECASAPSDQNDEDERRTTTGTRVERPRGQVLGASTSCSLYLTDYLRQDLENDPWQVTKLQVFLTLQGFYTPLTRVFDATTKSNVKLFQAKHYEDVLKPWYESGIVSHDLPTGYVYKTTQWKINDIMCPGIAPFPDLEADRG